MYYRFLNVDVEREVRADEELFICWCLTVGRHDDDIDPVHNKTYVQACEEHEVKRLAKLKEQIAKYRQLRLTEPPFVGTHT